MISALIRSKTRIPAVAETVIARGRVIEALAEAARGRRVLQVVASAGSGKTTAVVQFAGSRPGPRAWLTLGEADGSPGRFVTYLAAAAGGIDPLLPGRVQGMLARGVPPADCAALIAEALPPGATLVIDDLHLVESRPPVLVVLRALVEAVAPGALVVLVSRRLVHLNLARAVLTGHSGVVSGEDLSFTTPEVEQLLEARGVVATPEAVAAAGGWAAGIVFDALRGPREAGGGASADDPFFAYLGAEVLDAMPAEVRRWVVWSAIMHTVDAAGLEAVLGLPSGEAAMRAIRAQHLPATLEPEGLRYHPRFREFLLSRLREDPGEMRTLLIRHARRLEDLGHAEEAADHLIEAGETAAAQPLIEAATPGVLMRGDWDKVLAWCDAVGEEALSQRSSLRGCQLQAVIAGRRSQGPALVSALRESGEYDRLVREDPDAATTAVFGLHLCMDWSSLGELLPPDEASPGARAMRYVLQVGSGRTPPRPWRSEEVDRLSPNVGLFQCALYFQGRFDDVERLARLEDETGDHRSTALYRIAALRERGLLGDARAALDATAAVVRATGFSDFWRHMEGELVFAEGDRERGLQLVREARALTRALGHQPADRAIFASTEGKMLVRLGRHDEAAELLSATRRWCDERGLPCFGEWASTWLAAAMLGRGDPPEEAVALLEDAVAGMRAAERILELPAACAFLAEARWRAGDPAGHDRAAEDARAAARRMGTTSPLLAALADVPGVLERRARAGGEAGAAWRALAASGGPVREASDPRGVRMLLGTLGRPRVEIDGVARDITPLRALEVAAEVARAGPAGLSRASLAEHVMDDSTDAPNYLRQLVHRLRRLAPEGVELVSDGDALRWSPPGAVMTEDQLLASLLARARHETGGRRRATLAEALAIADGAERGRPDLEEAVSDARRAYAALLLDAGRAGEALAAARRAVGDDPYNEDAWRLLMRAAASTGGGPAAVPVYVECVRAMGAIGLSPSQETVDLLDRLREPVAGATARRA